MQIKLTILLVIIITSLSLSAQKLELGLIGGASLYSGDLSPHEFGLYFNDVNIAYGVLGRYSPTSALSIRFAYEKTKLSADDKNNNSPTIQQRGYTFQSDLSEVSLLLEWNIITLGQEGGFQVIPYFFAGGAYYSFNPQGRLANDWIDLQPLGTEGQGLPGYEAPYELSQFAIPVGGGLKFNLNKNVVLGLEMGARKLFTDYLDDVSGTPGLSYLDIRDGNGETAAYFSNPAAKGDEEIIYTRGGKFDDWYYLGNVTLSFRIGDRSGVTGGGRGRGIGCPGNNF